MCAFARYVIDMRFSATVPTISFSNPCNFVSHQLFSYSSNILITHLLISHTFSVFISISQYFYVQEKTKENSERYISKPFFFCCASPFLVLVKERCIRGNSSGHFLHKKTNTAGDRCASHPHSQCHIYNTLEKKYSLIQYILRMNE